MTQPQPTPPAQPEEKKLGFAGDAYTWLQALTGALLALALVFTFCGRIIGVDGRSMMPTLHHRDMLVLQSIGYTPRQGDVVVLHKDFGSVTDPIIKRVIALGGQTVDIDYTTGQVYVDGEAIDQSYLGETMVNPMNAYMEETHWEVPEGSVFVMGDNRNNSDDSRDVRLGPVDERYVIGRALWVLFPFSHFGTVEPVH